jgi:hypothetical protein
MHRSCHRLPSVHHRREATLPRPATEKAILAGAFSGTVGWRKGGISVPIAVAVAVAVAIIREHVGLIVPICPSPHPHISLEAR